MKVKCKECGQEYELESGESPSDFQCECGGDLIGKNTLVKPANKDKKTDKHRKTWSEQSNGIKALSIIIVIVFFLGIYAVISSLMSTGVC